MGVRSLVPQDSPRVGVVIVTGSCCIPGMAPFDEQARRIVTQGIAEAGVAAHVKVVPATSAFLGAVPRNVVAGLLTTFNQTGRVGLPAVLVNGELVSAGVPDLGTITAALLRAASPLPEEEQTRA